MARNTQWNHKLCHITNCLEGPIIIVSADPIKHDGASLKKILADMESLFDEW